MTVEQMLKKAIAVFPVDFSHGGKSYTGTRTSLKSELKYSDFGLMSRYKFSLLAVASDFATPPVCDDQITIDGTIYRVVGVGIDASGASLRVDLGEY